MIFRKKKPLRKYVIAILLLLIIFSGYSVYQYFFVEKTVIASVNPYNFTNVPVVDLFVDEQWGGSVHAYSGGGKSVCCVLIPEKWRKDLVVHVKWQKNEDPKWYTTVAKVPTYTEPAGLQVLFLPNDEIRVYVNDYWPCSAKHPMPKDPKLCRAKEK